MKLAINDMLDSSDKCKLHSAPDHGKGAAKLIAENTPGLSLYNKGIATSNYKHYCRPTPGPKDT